MKYLQRFIYLFIFGLPGILTIPNPLDHLTINLNIDEKDCEELGCIKKEIKTNDYGSTGCTESCTNFLNSNGYGQCKKVSKKMKSPICYVHSSSGCSDKRASTTNQGKYYSVIACQKKGCTDSCINYRNSRGFGLCNKISKTMKGFICYVHHTSTCTDTRESTSDPGFIYSRQACKQRVCTESCINFVNSRGFGRCKKHSKKMNGLICYVHTTSACTDIMASTSDRGKYYSAQACKNKGSVRPSGHPATQRPTLRRQCCGVSKSSNVRGRIVGGEDAKMHEFPWIVSLKIYVASLGWSMCGGSLIASQWILTAHHCTQDVTTPSHIKVTLGNHRMSTQRESNIEKKVSVSKIINHSHKLTWETDIALLKLSQPVSLKTYTPICLPGHTSSNKYVGQRVWVYGWGSTDYGGKTADILQKALVYVVSNKDCDAGFANQQLNFAPMAASQLCAGTKSYPHKDSCQGDSGGPLSYRRNGIHEQIGIVSYGMGCAVPGLFGVYSSVFYLKNWIENTINRNGGESLPSRC